MFGLVTGSGFYDIPDLIDRAVETVDTPYGSTLVTVGRWLDHDVVFLPRHGADHSVPPSRINYRANIWALRDAGATSIIATAVSGGIDRSLSVGDLVIISDFLDFTNGRATTFFDGSNESFDAARHHTDMTWPYDPSLRGHLLAAARVEGIDVVDGGVYATTNGPRFETPAEIEMMRMLGADLVGMTGYPEVALARELGIAYASIGVVSNAAAGMSTNESGPTALSTDDIFDLVGTVADPLHRLIARTLTLVNP